MTAVWVVIKGEYSDQVPQAAFSTQALADRWIADQLAIDRRQFNRERTRWMRSLDKDIVASWARTGFSPRAYEAVTLALDPPLQSEVRSVKKKKRRLPAFVKKGR